jgi:plastocyanin
VVLSVVHRDNASANGLVQRIYEGAHASIRIKRTWIYQRLDTVIKLVERYLVLIHAILRKTRVVVQLGVVPDVMKYDRTELTVKAGDRIRLVFRNTDHMQHNALLLAPGTTDTVGALADAMRAAIERLALDRQELGAFDERLKALSTALADTVVRALQIDSAAFARLRSTHPEAALEVALNIARELSLRVRAANLQLQADEIP